VDDLVVDPTRAILIGSPRCPTALTPFAWSRRTSNTRRSRRPAARPWSTFDVPGVDGATGVEFGPTGRTTTISEVLFPVGIYFVEYTIISDAGHGPEVLTPMAQAEAVHLRQLG